MCVHSQDRWRKARNLWTVGSIYAVGVPRTESLLGAGMCGRAGLVALQGQAVGWWCGWEAAGLKVWHQNLHFTNGVRQISSMWAVCRYRVNPLLKDRNDHSCVAILLAIQLVLWLDMCAKFMGPLKSTNYKWTYHGTDDRICAGSRFMFSGLFFFFFFIFFFPARGDALFNF